MPNRSIHTVVIQKLPVIKAGKLLDYTSKYFKLDAMVLTLALLLYGCSHFSLGWFLIHRFGPGPLLNGPITNAGIFKIICYPELSMFVGSLQMLTRAVGFIRSLRGPNSEYTRFRAYAFQGMCLANYLSVIALHVLTQIVSAPCTAGSQFAVSLPCNHVAFLP